jgi:uncharacterized RDD family membrane protein YckC
MHEHPPIWRADALTLAMDEDRGATLVTRRIAAGGSRAAAGAIDAAILFPWQAGAFFLALTQLPDPAPPPAVGLLALAVAIAGLVAPAVFEVAGRGFTPGKAACGLRVVSLGGAAPTLRALLVRNLLRLVDALPVGYLAGGVSMLASDMTQRLGDRAAGTLVVYDQPMSALLARASVPESVFADSEDGYLLEATVQRAHEFRDGLLVPLSTDLSRRLYGKYQPEDDGLRALYMMGRHMEFLRRFYDLEKQRAGHS